MTNYSIEKVYFVTDILILLDMSNQRHAFRTNCPHKYGAEIHIDRKILSAMGNSNPGIICISAPY